MKSAAKILKEMGFRSDAPDSLKEAFIRNLIKNATGVSVAPGPAERQELAKQGKHIQGEQLSFNFDEKSSTVELKNQIKKSS